MSDLDFWIPTRRRDLVKWLTDHYKKSFVHMKKKQLLTIYIETRKRANVVADYVGKVTI